MNQDPFYQESLSIPRTNALLRSVYNWMMLGLLVSALTAYFTVHSPTVMSLVYGNSIVLILLIVAELGMVFAISGGVKKMQASTASTMFLLFSFLNGLTLSAILLVYSPSAIAKTFLITSLTFGITSFYGYSTKKDLTSWGSFLFMGLIGIIIASVVNIFIRSSAMDLIISYIGVLIFVGLTAYDTQKIRRLGMEITPSAGEAYGRLSIIGALMLYLDFVNLFLMLLRIFGGGGRK